MWSLAAALAILSDAGAQQRQQRTPRIGYVYPAGGQQGQTFRVMVGGQYLNGANGAIVSGSGVRVTLADQPEALSQKELKALRTRLALLQQQKKKDPATLREIADIRKKLAKFMKKPATPAIAETVLLDVSLAPDTAAGEREIRLRTPSGLTNPLVFCVGQLPEFSEKAAETASERTSSAASRYRKPASGATSEAEPEITLPAVVNGQITPGGVDRYRFQARQGQQLVAAVRARGLIPYLADAVPGWFQATLTLYDAQGRELGYDDDFRFDPDPVLHCEIPADGEYVLEIKDAIYRGREDFVYRITVGELPYVTGIFPLGGPAGAKTTVQLQGWNLPVTELTMDSEDRTPGVYPVSVHRDEWVSNEVPFAVDTLPECFDREPNERADDAQLIELPVIINGRIDHPGDRDLFCFQGRAGQEIVAEVVARRLGSPLDSRLKLTDESGKELAANDDHEDKGAGLTTHAADSWLMATLPDDGTYHLSLIDAQQAGGPEYSYRLRISPPRPGFELRIVPSTINAGGGRSLPVTVYAFRKDGFSEEITLDLQDAPDGFALDNPRVPAGKDQASLTLTISRSAVEQLVNLHVEGRAAIQGKTVSHSAVPAEDMMQAFAYRHLVPVQELKVAVLNRLAAKGSLNTKRGGNKPTKKRRSSSR
jgi:hypothetical protein